MCECLAFTEERQRAEARERERQVEEERLRKLEQDNAEEKNSYAENIRQITEKVEKDKMKLKEELASIRVEQQRLEKEGYDDKAADMTNRINTLEKDVENIAGSILPGYIWSVWEDIKLTPVNIWKAIFGPKTAIN